MDCYQLLCELTAIKRHKLSDEARKKLQAAGVIKPESEYLQGIERGSKNIIKKHNIKVHSGDIAKPLADRFGGGGAAFLGPFGGKHVLLNPDSPGMVNPRDFAQIKRHELDEITTSVKLKKKYGKDPITQVRKNGRSMATHASPRVIKREYERHKQLENLYGPEKTSTVKFRNKSGEYNAIKDMPTRQLRKLERTASKESPTIVDKWKHMRKARKLKNPKLDFKAGAQWETSKKAIKSTVNKKPIAAKTVKTIAKKLTPKNAAHIKKFVKSLPK